MDSDIKNKVLEIVLMHGCSGYKFQDYCQGDQYIGIKLYSEKGLSVFDSEFLESELSVLSGKIVKITGIVLKANK